jgi:antitoxin component of MazEF toxin-antitoxin module
MKTYTVTTEEDPVTGECILPLPAELVTSLQWLEDDELNFEINGEEILIKNLSLNLRKEAKVD